MFSVDEDDMEEECEFVESCVAENVSAADVWYNERMSSKRCL